MCVVQMYVHESIHVCMYMCLFLFAYGGILACVCIYAYLPAKYVNNQNVCVCESVYV